MAQTVTQEVPSKYQEAYIYCVGDAALAHVAREIVEFPCWRLSKAIWISSWISVSISVGFYSMCNPAGESPAQVITVTPMRAHGCSAT